MKPYLKRAWAEISLSALQHNVSEISGLLQDGTEFMAVVKADAYGHGEEEILRKLVSLGIRYFGVSNLDEAIRVRSFCPDSEILILGHTPSPCANLLTEHNIIQGIVSKEYACMLNGRAKAPVRCHIKLDTGMGRVGLRADDAEDCAEDIEDLLQLRNLKIEGLYTHLSVADTNTPAQKTYTNTQIQRILDVKEALSRRGIRIPHLHYLNSAGLLNYNSGDSTLARVGIILYGLAPNYPTSVPLNLKPVMSLKSIVSLVKRVPAGTSISYGRTYTTKKPAKIATVTIGYADGYPRLLSSKADVLIHGKRCPIVGRICMDQLMVNVTALEDVAPGDEVTLIGQDGDACITADELAAIYDSIGYELVCGISKRVPRVYK